MAIDSIGSNYGVYAPNVTTNKQQENRQQASEVNVEATQKVITDRLELSEDAKRIGMIQNNLSNGYYESNEFIQLLAQKLDQAFPPTSLQNAQ